jgi:hypothetical protein
MVRVGEVEMGVVEAIVLLGWVGIDIGCILRLYAARVLGWTYWFLKGLAITGIIYQFVMLQCDLRPMQPCMRSRE